MCLVVPASFDGVDNKLCGPKRTVLHFICHGKTATVQTLQLEDSDTLSCVHVLAMKGFQNAFALGPLAFLNACEIGGQVLTLHGVGGFANSFIELGAAAVIAPLWAVKDAVAVEVTKLFYPDILGGKSFAAALQDIRKLAYTPAAEDSYAAYCFYGDPLAVAVLADKK